MCVFRGREGECNASPCGDSLPLSPFLSVSAPPPTITPTFPPPYSPSPLLPSTAACRPYRRLRGRRRGGRRAALPFHKCGRTGTAPRQRLSHTSAHLWGYRQPHAPLQGGGVGVPLRLRAAAGGGCAAGGGGAGAQATRRMFTLASHNTFPPLVFTLFCFYTCAGGPFGAGCPRCHECARCEAQGVGVRRGGGLDMALTAGGLGLIELSVMFTSMTRI